MPSHTSRASESNSRRTASILAVLATCFALAAVTAQPAAASTGGPDAFGYRFRDNLEAHTPLFSWVDISASGANVPFGNETRHGPFPIGFTFNFYGADYTDVWLSSNGWLRFGAADPADADNSNDCPLPNAAGVENIVAGIWDNLTDNGTGRGYYQSFPAGSCPYGDYPGACFVASWVGMFLWAVAPTDDLTFEIILFDNNDIMVQIQDASSEKGQHSTTGIENSTATIGLTYACNTLNSLANGRSILFKYPGGACCLPDGTCVHEANLAGCNLVGGAYHGDGSDCGWTMCPPAAAECRRPFLAIPDNNVPGVTDGLLMPGTGVITDLNVYLDINHTWVGDLVVTLTHVDTGTTVTILDRPGVPPGLGCGRDDITAVLDDQAASPVETRCSVGVPTIRGSFIPNNPLAAFNGESINGTWQLNVSDSVGGDVGTLLEWCLMPTLIADTDGDGVADVADNCPALSNPGQADADGDGFGDACDGCPTDPAKVFPGICGCNVADTDSDGDAIPDCLDNCPNNANTDQADSNGNGIGDVCDPAGPGPAGGGPTGQTTVCGCGAGATLLAPLMVAGLAFMRRRIGRR